MEASAFDADRGHVAEVSKPGEQLELPALVGAELSLAEDLAVCIDRSCVMSVLLGVNSADDDACRSCHARCAFRYV